jgi:hypothetical protein
MSNLGTLPLLYVEVERCAYIITLITNMAIWDYASYFTGPSSNMIGCIDELTLSPV